MVKNKRYHCHDCEGEFSITVIPKKCPICGSSKVYRGTKKSADTTNSHIQRLNIIIPEMQELSNKFSKLYTEYMTLHETLKTYIHKGIVDKSDVPNFKIPNYTKAFYASRMKTPGKNQLEIDGVTKSYVEWGEEYNLNASTIRMRVKAGWSGTELLKPVKKRDEKVRNGENRNEQINTLK